MSINFKRIGNFEIADCIVRIDECGVQDEQGSEEVEALFVADLSLSCDRYSVVFTGGFIAGEINDEEALVGWMEESAEPCNEFAVRFEDGTNPSEYDFGMI